jgi:hypothetical protein
VNLHQVLEPYFERGERPTLDGGGNSQENKTQK